GRTLHHDGLGHFGAGRVTIRTAPAGTGIIAGGPMRAIFESLGVADVVTKSVGTSNPYNMIRATFEALREQTSPRSVAQRRGKDGFRRRGKGEPKAKLAFKVAGVAKGAGEAVEKAGGSIELIGRKNPAELAAAKKGKARDARIADKAAKSKA